MLCQFCAQIARSIPPPTRSPSRETIHCPTCTGTPHTHSAHTPCSSCIVFALLAQNTYAIRWDTIVFQPTPLTISPLPSTIHTQHTPSTPTSLPPTAVHSHQRHRNFHYPQSTQTTTEITHITSPLLSHIALPTQVILVASAILTAIPAKNNRNHNHIPHKTLPLKATHLHRLATILLQSSSQHINETSVFHYLYAIGHHTHCQPNRHVQLHLNQHTHNITHHTYVHQPAHFTIALHITTNNPYVTYSSVSPHYAPTTALVHLAAPARPTHKRKRHKRASSILPDVTRIITLPTLTSALHQQLTLITATHLVLTTPQPRDIPWSILNPIDVTTHTLHRILATLCLRTTYPLWTTSPSAPNPTRRRPPTCITHPPPAPDSIDTHLIPPSLPPPTLPKWKKG